MNPEDKKLLTETFELAKENNALLKKIYSNIVWGRVLRAVYWVVIIAASVGAFYAIQPYIDSITGAYDQVTGVKSDIGNYFNF